MPQPTLSDVHVNRPLTNVSVAYIQEEGDFVADKIFPIIPVEFKSDLYFVYDKDSWFRDEAKARAPGTESAGSGYTVNSSNSYLAIVNSFHKDVDDQTRANSDSPLQPDSDATRSSNRTGTSSANSDERWLASTVTA